MSFCHDTCCLKQVINASHFPIKIQVENSSLIFIHLSNSMSAGVCRVPSHYECEPTQPFLLQAWQIHTTTGRLVQAESITDRQDSRGAVGDPKDLWPAREFKINFAMGTMLVTYCADITDWDISTINVKFDCVIVLWWHTWWYCHLITILIPHLYSFIVFLSSTSFPVQCHFKSHL